MTTNDTTAATKPTKFIPLVKRFNEVIKLRETWEVGAYKASNDQLYEILAAAYELYLHLFSQTNPDDRKSFANLLKAKKVEYQTNTPLHTRVVRLVFATTRQRAYTYGRVLLAARKENIAPSYLPDWIRDSGGIEDVKVKSSGKQTPTEKATADADYASDVFANAKPIAVIGKVPDLLKPDGEHNPIYSVALVRCDNGKDAEIVWGTSNAAAIAKVLALAGKSLRTEAEKKAVTNIKRAAARNARTAITQAASTVKQKVKTAAPLQKLAA